MNIILYNKGENNVNFIETNLNTTSMKGHLDIKTI